MIKIEKEAVATIPMLHVVDEKLSDLKLPTIFFLHGYTSAKEHNLHVAYLLAEKGFRVVLPDALHHGEREGAVKGKERDLSFWDIVLTSIEELPLIKKALVVRNIVDEKRIGVIGTSMGAITLYGALTKYKWIHSVVSFMGTAYYEEFALKQIDMMKQKGIDIEPHIETELFNKLEAYDLSKQLEQIGTRSLLIWHGTEDTVVPFEYSNKLYKELTVHDDANKELLFLKEEGITHKVTRFAVLRSVAWFEEHFLDPELIS